jgi:hypothetical protein
VWMTSWIVAAISLSRFETTGRDSDILATMTLTASPEKSGALGLVQLDQVRIVGDARPIPLYLGHDGILS